MIGNWTSRLASLSQAIFNVAFVLAIATTVSCVSVNLGPGKTERSSDVRYSKPEGGFAKFDSTGADIAWKNSKTGSTIAFQSACGDGSDLPLEAIAGDLISSFEEAKPMKSERRMFDGREGLDTEVEGKVDGVLTRARAIVYKKNRCSYVLTYIALSKSVENGSTAGDLAQFERFLVSFKAP